jgi:hypothetical protein
LEHEVTRCLHQVSQFFFVFSLPQRHQVIKGIKFAACGLGFTAKGQRLREVRCS